MDKFEDLQAFVAVVEAGSFTAAADRLGSDKSAVSRRVSALEDRLGVQLLRRTTRTLTITDTGQSFFRHSARILSDLEEAESAVAQAHGELRGKLKVALPLSFGIRHMCEPISAFKRLHPAVEFELDLSDRFVDLLQDGVDVAVRIGDQADSSLIARRIFQSRLVVCASPEYLEEHGRPSQPEELAEHACLVYTGTSDPEYWQWQSAHGEPRRVKVDAVMAANSGDLLLDAAANSMGIVCQPSFLAHEHVRAGKLLPILCEYQWPVAIGHAVYPPTRHLSYRVRSFIDFLAEHFKGTADWDSECHYESSAT